MSKQIVVVGSINVDLVLSVDEFPQPGETVLAKQQATFPGGKGANQAVAIRRLGGRVRMVGKIGRDPEGELAFSTLEREEVETSHVRSLDGARTGLAVIQVNSHGENTIVVCPGANSVWPEADTEIEALLDGCSMVVMQMEIPLAVVEATLRAAKRRGLYTILNAAPADRAILPALRQVDLLIVNETEAALLAGREWELGDVGSLREAAGRLAGFGTRNVLITLGSQGCLACLNGELHAIPSHAVDVVDTTAAGDAFVGAVATRLSAGDGVLAAARWATAAGALTVTRLGSQSAIPTKDEVNTFVAESRRRKGCA